MPTTNSVTKAIIKATKLFEFFSFSRHLAHTVYGFTIWSFFCAALSGVRAQPVVPPILVHTFRRKCIGQV